MDMDELKEREIVEISPEKVDRNIIYKGKPYRLVAKTKKDPSQTITCPFCGSMIVLSTVARETEVDVFSLKRIRWEYEEPDNTTIDEVVGIANYLLQQELIDQIKQDESCPHCLPKFADDCSDMDHFILPD